MELCCPSAERYDTRFSNSGLSRSIGNLEEWIMSSGYGTVKSAKYGFGRLAHSYFDSPNSARCKSAPVVERKDPDLRCNKRSISNHQPNVISNGGSQFDSIKASSLTFTNPEITSSPVLFDHIESGLEDKENYPEHFSTKPFKSPIISKPKFASNLSNEEVLPSEIDCDVSSELQLDNFPLPKENLRPLSSTIMTSNILVRGSTISLFLNSFSDVEKKLHPRLLYNHQIDYIDGSEYRYRKNLNCPTSINTNLDVCVNKKLNESNIGYIKFMFMRVSQDGEHPEALCRFCPHRKWVSVDKFEIHLAFAHGIISYEKNLILLPLPTGYFEITSSTLIDTYVRCPTCDKWVRLDYNSVSKMGSRPQGLYQNYFSHYMTCDSK